MISLTTQWHLLVDTIPTLPSAVNARDTQVSQNSRFFAIPFFVVQNRSNSSFFMKIVNVDSLASFWQDEWNYIFPAYLANFMLLITC